jgi:hypothetical protein
MVIPPFACEERLYALDPTMAYQETILGRVPESNETLNAATGRNASRMTTMASETNGPNAGMAEVGVRETRKEVRSGLG